MPPIPNNLGARPPIVPRQTRPPVGPRTPIGPTQPRPPGPPVLRLPRIIRPTTSSSQPVATAQPVGPITGPSAIQAPISQGSRHINRYVNEEGFIVDSQGRYVVNNQG